MLRGEAGLSPVVATLAERERRARIVRYWRAIEMFSPQQVGRVSPERRMFPVDARRPLPWEQGHALRDAPVPAGMVWQHTVYCGIFRTSAARDVLLEVFGGSEEDHDTRVDGDSALLAFEVTDEGRLIGESITFSSCAWAVGQARSPGPAKAGWLDGFDGDATSCAEVVLDVGDGRLTIVERGGGSQQPFAGLMYEIVLSAAGGAIAPLVAPLLGTAAGAVVGGAQAAAERALRERRRAGAGHEDRDDEDEEDGPRLGSRQLTVRDLSAVTRWLSDRFGVTTDLMPTAVRVQSRLVSLRRADKATGADFLNSFIATDLALVAGQLATSEPGKALGDYLTASTAIRTDRRLDLRRNPAAVLAGVEPERFPLGRWPAKTEHPLVRSQQFAVNDILERLADDGGVYAVNGPPGTGKTTQLRDLIAGVLVLRAQRLATLTHPTAAFTGPTHRWTTGHLHRSVCEPATTLVGFEMVVASANNGAVENVSRQIPELESVDEAWRAQASYFPDQGRLILDGAQAWGALAAPLGNRGNRQDFRDRYWFGTDREKQSASAANGRPRNGSPRNGSPRTGTVPRVSGSGQGMRDLLKRVAQQPPDQGAWRTAVNRFREAERAVRALRDERQPAARALRELPGAQWAVRTGQDAARDADQRHRATLAALTDATERLATLEGDVRRWAERQAEHRRTRPGAVHPGRRAT
ncbi:hypothetical protein MXD63_17240 [Frankia sp. Cpl3]|uniref:hypothetical protein n=1 Tax=Parafrankia colletiae TaxID=573497 RepID=UPI0010421F68|nr:hypothetical protein [Parafrankia colletiae]MCK9901815.1 hypothetical protein [Frankia sp. Cpl3]